jgi:hypothetical protein
VRIVPPLKEIDPRPGDPGCKATLSLNFGHTNRFTTREAMMSSPQSSFNQF